MFEYQQEIAKLRGEIISLKQNNISLKDELSIIKRKQPQISVIEKENSYYIEKLYILEENITSLSEENEKQKEINKLEKKNNQILEKRIYELTSQISHNLSENIYEHNVWESLPKLKNALIDTSRKLGTARTQIIFLHNQLKRDALQIDQQLKIIYASQRKEELTKMYCHDKVQHEKEKFIKSKQWYKNTNLKYQKQIENLQNDNVVLKESNNYKKNTILTLKKYPIKQSEKDITLLNELNDIYETKYTNTTEMSHFLEKERLKYLEILKDFYICEQYKQTLQDDHYKNKERQYSIVKKIDEIRESSNALYIKKLAESQNEVRSLRELLDKNKLLQENIRLEMQSSRLNID